MGAPAPREEQATASPGPRGPGWDDGGMGNRSLGYQFYPICLLYIKVNGKTKGKMPLFFFSDRKSAPHPMKHCPRLTIAGLFGRRFTGIPCQWGRHRED